MSYELNGLMRFAGRALSEARMEGIGDWDGGDLEDAMVECGLLAKVDVTESCGEGCRCAEYGFPVTCLRFTDLAQRCIAARSLSGSGAPRTPENDRP